VTEGPRSSGGSREDPGGTRGRPGSRPDRPGGRRDQPDGPEPPVDLGGVSDESGESGESDESDESDASDASDENGAPDCVIPAAGLSSRMTTGEESDVPEAGYPKSLLELQGKPLLLHAVDNALAVCRRCIVVTGHGRKDVEALLRRARPGVEVVFNSDYRQGMFSSIRAGSRLVRSEWFFVAPGDMPMLAPELYRMVLSAARSVPVDSDHHDPDGAPATASQRVAAWFPEYRGRRGHPVLINRTVVSAMNAGAPDGRPWTSMRAFLSGFSVRDVPVSSDSIFLDIDTPKTLREARERYRNIPVGNGT
jgi:molybdenum cofactor cytidylyltransferase